ncbi:hypothetical protein ACVIIW_001742 [Bradyrhizobium sp. USDA 4449]
MASQPDAPVSQSAPGRVQQERAAAESLPEAAAVSVHAAAALRPGAAVSVHAAAALRPGAAVVSVHAAAALRPGAAVVSVHAAAAPRPGAAAVSVHAAAAPQPGASAAWVLQAVAGAVPDGSGVAASGVTARRPAEVRRADAAVQLPAELRWVPWARQAAARSDARAVLPLALPSEAASAFRQGRSLEAEPARRRAVRFAHAMRSLRIASRSEPSWQAARSEDWSCREIPRKVLWRSEVG